MIIELKFPIPPSTLFSAAYTASLIGVTEQAMKNWRDKRIGPAYAYADGQIMYRLADIQQWAVEQEVARFMKVAQAISGSIEVESPIPSPDLPALGETSRPVRRQKRKVKIVVAPTKKHASGWNRWHEKHDKTHPVPAKKKAGNRPIPPSTPAPEPVRPAVPPPSDLDQPLQLKGLGPTKAIVMIMEAVKQPMTYRDIRDYLKFGGYEGSIDAVSVAINALRKKNLVKKTDEGWIPA